MQLKAGDNQIAILIGLKPVTANFLMYLRNHWQAKIILDIRALLQKAGQHPVQ
jgi:hypothetical protein